MITCRTQVLGSGPRRPLQRVVASTVFRGNPRLYIQIQRHSMSTNEFEVNWENRWPVNVQVLEGAQLTHQELEKFPPFRPWFDKLCQSLDQENSKIKGTNTDTTKGSNHKTQAANAMYQFRQMEIQSVDKFGNGKIGFIKLKSHVVHPNGKELPGIIVLRGGTVAILVVLEVENKPAPQKDKYVVLIEQPRIAASTTQLAELPAGMLDDGEFRGQAAKELEEECGIRIQENDKNFIDLSTQVLGNDILISPGFTDEHIRFYMYTKQVSQKELDEMNGRQSRGAVDENEQIRIKIVPLNKALTSTNDAKCILALSLYNRYCSELL